MKAMVIRAHGGPEVLEMADLPDPEVAPAGGVRVRAGGAQPPRPLGPHGVGRASSSPCPRPRFRRGRVVETVGAGARGERDRPGHGGGAESASPAAAARSAWPDATRLSASTRSSASTPPVDTRSVSRCRPPTCFPSRAASPSSRRPASRWSSDRLARAGEPGPAEAGRDGAHPRGGIGVGSAGVQIRAPARCPGHRHGRSQEKCEKAWPSVRTTPSTTRRPTS